ncbi:hypothetical protein [Komagataeibacter xylinus]|uniref:hypothetical protein n=1 Tax=Komagataeibacter xylinus TaxID=28448 RepID=UPI0007748741|nr:hypothetical protein [Komagataeibacter xylinus]
MLKASYGNRQAHALCTMSYSARLDFIAEGLPIILKSAQGFWNASRQLNQSPREAGVLVGFAEEEAAKTLILLDIVRCPPAQVSSRVGRIVKKVFYDHLARLIYAEAQSWKPVDVAQLQEYVDTKRQSHYLEGGMNEYIMPNWALYSRESVMYVDIEVYEDGKPQWNDPHRWSEVTMGTKPISLLLTEALSALGMFSRAGVRATADVWGAVNFVDSQGHTEARNLTHALAARLDTEGLVTEQANESHVHAFCDLWQIPMYSIDFNKIDIPLEQLKAEREAAYWAEVDYEHYDDY